MVFSTTVLVDGRTHMLGRLASIVAKELLSGQKVVVVRCEHGRCEQGKADDLHGSIERKGPSARRGAPYLGTCTASKIASLINGIG